MKIKLSISQSFKLWPTLVVQLQSCIMQTTKSSCLKFISSHKTAKKRCKKLHHKTHIWTKYVCVLIELPTFQATNFPHVYIWCLCTAVVANKVQDTSLNPLCSVELSVCFDTFVSVPLLVTLSSCDCVVSRHMTAILWDRSSWNCFHVTTNYSVMCRLSDQRPTLMRVSKRHWKFHRTQSIQVSGLRWFPPSRTLYRTKSLPVTHVLMDTWMLTVKPVYKL